MIYADSRDILTVTMRHNGAYIPTDGQTEQTGSENRSVATTRMPESVSGEGGRSALRGIGFLRRPRSGSGEVRDGAAARNVTAAATRPAALAWASRAARS